MMWREAEEESSKAHILSFVPCLCKRESVAVSSEIERVNVSCLTLCGGVTPHSYTNRVLFTIRSTDPPIANLNDRLISYWIIQSIQQSYKPSSLWPTDSEMIEIAGLFGSLIMTPVNI